MREVIVSLFSAVAAITVYTILSGSPSDLPLWFSVSSGVITALFIRMHA